MDYERILKPSSQGGGFSPGKLRAMLLGVEKRRTDESEHDSRSSLRSDFSGPGEADADDCRDVGVVVVPDRSAPPSGGLPESALSSSTGFEFQKARSALVPPFSKPAPSKWDDAQKWILSPSVARGSKHGGGPQKKCGNRQAATKVVNEVGDEADTKQVDSYPTVDKCEKPTFLESSVSDPAIRLSQHDPLTSQPTAFIAPAPSTVRAVSMRDMGTEMTPIASQEPSRTGTPVRATTPSHSPSSSQPSSPRRSAPILSAGESAGCYGDRDSELTEKELQRKTRREIMLLGTQLGKANIAAWASKEEEERDASVSLKRAKSIVESRAVAWEEAKKAKYMARFKEEEVKIEAWENHQKAKAEAETREIEVKVERMKTCAQDRLLNKLAAIRNKAEEKRATAEAKRNQQAARTAQQADYIRQTGRIPSSFTCCCWRWCR